MISGNVNFIVVLTVFFARASKANNCEIVTLELMRSYCLPIIFYSVEALFYC